MLWLIRMTPIDVIDGTIPVLQEMLYIFCGAAICGDLRGFAAAIWMSSTTSTSTTMRNDVDAASLSCIVEGRVGGAIKVNQSIHRHLHMHALQWACYDPAPPCPVPPICLANLFSVKMWGIFMSYVTNNKGGTYK